MLRQLAVRVIRAMLLLEGLRTALWIAAILPGLPVRDPVSIMLVVLRAAVAALQVACFLLMLRDASAGRRWARWSLLSSALLLVPEIGLRLAPTSSDPTFRWMYVSAYAVYALAASIVLR